MVATNAINLEIVCRALLVCVGRHAVNRLFDKPFRIRHNGPSCRLLFKREDGFFVGAIFGKRYTELDFGDLLYLADGGSPLAMRRSG